MRIVISNMQKYPVTFKFYKRGKTDEWAATTVAVNTEVIIENPGEWELKLLKGDTISIATRSTAYVMTIDDITSTCDIMTGTGSLISAHGTLSGLSTGLSVIGEVSGLLPTDPDQPIETLLVDDPVPWCLYKAVCDLEAAWDRYSIYGADKNKMLRRILEPHPRLIGYEGGKWIWASAKSK